MTIEKGETAAQPVNLSAELESMRVVGETLSSLDSEARRRVLGWAIDHFGISRGVRASRERAEQSSDHPPENGDEEQEIAGIARINNGRLEMTIRDLKAHSMVDAAIRLAHIVILANEKLTGTKTVSSRKILVPILKEWRAYDGNIRRALAGHKGIHRTGTDELSLDALSRQEAQRYFDQVLDDSVAGAWNPQGRAIRKSSKKLIVAVPTKEAT